MVGRRGEEEETEVEAGPETEDCAGCEGWCAWEAHGAEQGCSEEEGCSEPNLKRTAKSLPPHVEAAMRNAGLRPEDRDARGLMPLAKARKLLRGLRTVVRGKSRDINDTFVWDSDLALAALLSLKDDKELAKKSALDWKMPPRGLDVPAVAERYGDGAIDWVNGHLARNSEGPGLACLAATVLACSATPNGLSCALSLDARRPDALVLWQWLRKNPAGWGFLAADLARKVPDRLQALSRLARTDAKGAFAALAAASDDASTRAAFEAARLKAPAGVAKRAAHERGGRTPISLGVVEPYFKDFNYPMWRRSRAATRL